VGALWVIEFPLFEIDKESGQLTYGHNPFSLPTAETIDYMESEPLKVYGAQYDLVLNGTELGSGSLRNHDVSVQRAVLRALGYDDERMGELFGWFLEALEYGARPRRHGHRLGPAGDALSGQAVHPRRHRFPRRRAASTHDGGARRGRGGPAQGAAHTSHVRRRTRLATATSPRVRTFVFDSAEVPGVC